VKPKRIDARVTYRDGCPVLVTRYAIGGRTFRAETQLDDGVAEDDTRLGLVLAACDDEAAQLAASLEGG